MKTVAGYSVLLYGVLIGIFVSLAIALIINSFQYDKIKSELFMTYKKNSRMNAERAKSLLIERKDKILSAYESAEKIQQKYYSECIHELMVIKRKREVKHENDN